MMKVGDFGLGAESGVKSTFTVDSDWAKPSGWSGFIDVAASKAKGVTFPTGAMFTAGFVIWTVLGRRDTWGGYVGILTDYGTGRSWIGSAEKNTNAPTFTMIYSGATTSAFIQSLMDDADQAAAQVTLGIGGMINGITYKNVSGNANVALSAAETNVGVIILTGALTANISVSVPATTGVWSVLNRTTGGFTVTFKTAAAGSVGQLILQGRQSQVFSDGAQIYFAATAFEGGYFRGEVISEAINSFRMVTSASAYGTFWRQDGNALYLMLTNQNDQLGNYNNLRPFAMSLATGKIALSQGVTTLTMPDGTVTLDVATCEFVQRALALCGISTMTSVNVADLDQARIGGFYKAGKDTAKIPPLSANYSVMVLPFNDGGCLQVATQLGGTSRSFTRTQAGGNWTAWRESLYSDSTTLAGSPATNDISKLAATTEFVRNVMAAHGLGTADLNDQLSGIDLNDMRTSGWWQVNSAVNAPAGFVSGVLTTVSNATYYTQQTFMPQGVNRMFQRASNGQTAGFTPWREMASTDYADALDAKGLGEVSFYAMSTPPAGKLKCNGAVVSRTTYAALFDKIGTQYGAGDGSTTFSLPDLRGYFLRAWDDGRGVDAGRAMASTQAGQNASHTHGATVASAGAHTHITTLAREYVDGNVVNKNAVFGDQINEGTNDLPTSSAGAHVHTVTIAASGGNEARPANVAMLACIQY
jgi:microcystin-dependent protein